MPLLARVVLAAALRAAAGACPDAWAPATRYYAGDRVAHRVDGDAPPVRRVHQCRDYPHGLYCGQEAFAPGSQHADMA